MCGIVGIINSDADEPVSEDILTSMRDTMDHRGPDGFGNFVERNIGLGHRRLSIIDLEGGVQPITSDDGSISVVYNGEIYNYRNIRDRLIRKGYCFKTSCDTEVILRLYEDKGIDCVDEFNGMFAFAIYDSRKGSLFLARDRMGIKPLYYVLDQKHLLFASEIKAFLKHPDFFSRLNTSALTEYFIFRCLSGADTLFKNVISLKPGHILEYRQGNIQIKKFWAIDAGNEPLDITVDALIERFDFLLNDSVKLRLMSDVPLGTFCSGGIDSSLITAIAARNTSNSVNTFSVGFNEPQYDESEYAATVSDLYNTTHHQLVVGHLQFADYFPKMIWQNDEPLNFANSIQIYAISKLAKEFVTVVLTGEGSDELFWGYPRYQIPMLLRDGSCQSKIFKLFLPFLSSLVTDHRIKSLHRNLRYTAANRLLLNSASIDEEIAKAFIKDHFNPSWASNRQNTMMGKDLVRDILLLEKETYLLSILQRQDKMSMAAGIESRVPFLDHRIAEFAYRMPDRAKINLLKSKPFVKKAAKPYLPGKVIHRRKSGFGVPLADWFKSNNGLGLMIEDIHEWAKSDAFVDVGVLRKMIDEHKANLRDHSDALWTVANFLLWKKTFKLST